MRRLAAVQRLTAVNEIPGPSLDAMQSAYRKQAEALWASK